MVNRNTNNLVEVRKNLKHGKGLFALKDLKQGEKVYSFKKGKVIGPDQIKKLSETEKRYLDKISVDEYEIIKPPGCYVNHSCDPNVEEKNMTAHTLRNIGKGEEITIDYDQTAYVSEPFRCHCGSNNCRGSVRGKQ